MTTAIRQRERTNLRKATTITTTTITKRQPMRGHGLRDTRRLTTRLTVDKSEDEVRDTINDEGKLGQNVRGNEIGEGQCG